MHRPDGGTEKRGTVQDPTVVKRPAKNIAQAQGRVLLHSFVPREQCKNYLKPKSGL